MTFTAKCHLCQAELKLKREPFKTETCDACREKLDAEPKPPLIVTGFSMAQWGASKKF